MKLESVHGGSLRERVKRHAALVNELRCAYLSERRRRSDEQLVPHSVSCALLNAANMLESAWSTLNRLEMEIEDAEKKADCESIEDETRQRKEVERLMAIGRSCGIEPNGGAEPAQHEAENVGR
ncbi:hypothetical protein M0R72_10940 [Candidatus Pacearchaeota archaeon]|nr:hypothetical protein [Candidatus Pacearchaeota archaeon]